MTLVSPRCRVIACAVLIISPLHAIAQRPVISSCVVSPSTVAPGGTAKIHVQATSPAGLPLEYTYSVTAGAVRGDGASATYTADASITGMVTVLCEARDSRQSWMRSRTWIKVIAAGTAGASIPATGPPHPEPVVGAASKGGVEKATVPHAAPPPSVSHPALSSSVLPLSAPQSLAPAPATTTKTIDSAQTSPDDSQQGDEVDLSKNGLIEYKVPQKMVVGTTSQVTVKIHGDEDKQGASADATRKRSLKASQYMKVLLLAEDSSEFEILPQGNADVQFVPNDSSVLWVWSVTPVHPATGQKLQVRVYLEDKLDAEQEVDKGSYTVNVKAPSAMAIVKNAYFEDPDALWKYWLPSGAGCAVLVVLFSWVINRRKKRSDTGMAHKFSVDDWI